MRTAAIFLLSICISTACMAQPAPAGAPGEHKEPQPGDKVIYKLGLDGRKGTGIKTFADGAGNIHAPTTAGTATATGTAPGAVPSAMTVAAPADQAAAKKTEEPKMRSDKKMKSDASIAREKREALEKAKEEAAKAKATAATTPTAMPALPPVTGNAPSMPAPPPKY